LILQAGSNAFPIEVTAADGATKTTYEITLNRAAAPQLSALSIGGTTLSPTFSANTTSYSATVPFETDAVTVTPTATIPGASITINGTAGATGQPSSPITLSQGINNIVVRVAVGSESRDYTVDVTRAAQVPRLSTLQLSIGTLNPAFDPVVTTYVTAVSFLTNQIVVTPTTAIPGASIKVNGASVLSGQASAAIPLDVGANMLTVRVTLSGQNLDYMIALERLAAATVSQEALLTSNFPVGQAEFGSVIAIDGDTLVVGEPNGPYNGGGSPEGRVSVFVRSGTNWALQQAFYGDPLFENGARFGASVALQGDTMVVGAPLHDNQGMNAGLAFVYTRSAMQWTQVAVLSASNAGANDEFGFDVDIDGNTIVISAPKEDTIANDAGAVYVYTGSGANWTQQGPLLNSNNPFTLGLPGKFGFSVSLDGDNLAVGKPLIGGDFSSVYIFRRNAGTWTQQARLEPPFTGTSASDEFGVTLELQGETLVVGSPFYNNHGAAYVFAGSGTQWVALTRLTASNAGAGDRFGNNVGLLGDTIVVGAPFEDSSGTDSGSVYLFRGEGSTWTENRRLNPTGPVNQAYFGSSAQLDGERIVIGAQNQQGGTVGQAGTCYVFR
jgi:hypothetical protein